MKLFRAFRKCPGVRNGRMIAGINYTLRYLCISARSRKLGRKEGKERVRDSISRRRVLLPDAPAAVQRESSSRGGMIVILPTIIIDR